MPESSVLPTAIYQLRVVLCGVSPLVWRRLLVTSDTSISELHEILQSSFDWSGEHLHRFLPTVLNQTAKGLPERIGEGEDQYELRPGVLRDLERIKWYLWHGNVFQALNELQSLEMDLDAAAFESKDENSQKLLKGVEDLHAYIERNQDFVPNYGEKIASGFVESAINQIVSKRIGEETTNGVEPAWSTSSPVDTNPGTRRRVGEHLPVLVSGFPLSKAS